MTIIAPRDHVAVGRPKYLLGHLTDTLLEWQVDTLGEAVQLLSDGYSPESLGSWGFVADDEYVVIGWSFQHPTSAMSHWTGTAEAFGLLYQIRPYGEVVWFDLQAETALRDLVLPRTWTRPFEKREAL